MHGPLPAGPLRLLLRRAKASGAGHVGVSGVERDVLFADAGADTHPDIDAAYHSKCDRYGPAIVGSVVGDKSVPVMIRPLPRA